MQIIDLRSDTVTHPSQAMWEAMLNAELGDDVFADDPTVNRLQETAAARFGKEAALLVPSGTMANLVSVLVHCPRGSETILGNKSHTFMYEGGGIAAFGGVHPHTLPNQEDGTLRLEDIKSAIRVEDDHFPRTRLIALENTHNKCSGTPLTPEYIASVSAIARSHGLSLHMDGARIFNAAVALNTDVSVLSEKVDSVSFCMSKGLSAPVGSVICGTKDFICEARRVRKALGGGMRQAGVLAAAGLIALDEMIPQIKRDHDNAKLLAEGLANIPAFKINPSKIKTNIVYFELADTDLTVEEIVNRAEEKGVRFLATGSRQFRVVTHYGVEQGDILKTLDVLGLITKP
ncbi:MAG: low-specificity L-threonine aldolase [Fidelibacterota bacterium]